MAQRAAALGMYARAIAGFIRWLAPRLDQVRQEFKSLTHRWRIELPSSVHPRTADAFAQLAASWNVWLQFVVAVGACTSEAAATVQRTIWQTLADLAVAQQELQRAYDPVIRFFQLLNSVLTSGKAHIGAAERPDRPPPKAEDALALGWRRQSINVGQGMIEESWKPQGPCIGWWSEAGIYLDPEASYAAAQQLGSSSGEGIGVASTTLYRRMYERKLLLSTERQGNEMRLRARKQIGGKRRHILHVAHSLTPYASWTGPSGPIGPIGGSTQQNEEVV